MPEGIGRFGPIPGAIVHALPYPDDGFVTSRSDGSVEVGGAPGTDVSAYVLTLVSAETAGSPVAASPSASPVP